MSLAEGQSTQADGERRPDPREHRYELCRPVELRHGRQKHAAEEREGDQREEQES